MKPSEAVARISEGAKLEVVEPDGVNDDAGLLCEYIHGCAGEVMIRETGDETLIGIGLDSDAIIFRIADGDGR